MASTGLATHDTDTRPLSLEDESFEVDAGGALAAPEVRVLCMGMQQHAQRLDRALAESVPEFSRSYLQQLLALGAVSLNGVPVVKSAQKVKAGDRVCLEMRPTLQSQAFRPELMAIDVVYEDDHLLVVNKPAGLVVHPAPGNWSGTLLNGLMGRDPGAAQVPRAGIVHRLDKDTSGCLVVAKNDLAHQNLSEQLAKRTLKRTYIALVHGVIQHNVGTIEAPIGRDKSDRQKMTVTSMNARPALTHFKVLKRYEAYTLVECQLDTGRTHQIRVHFQYINYPIVGDPKYSIKKTLETQGQCLHAQRIEFIHPRTKEVMQFEAEMPEVFKQVLEELDKA